MCKKQERDSKNRMTRTRLAAYLWVVGLCALCATNLLSSKQVTIAFQKNTNVPAYTMPNFTDAPLPTIGAPLPTIDANKTVPTQPVEMKPLMKTNEQLLRAIVSQFNQDGVPYFVFYGTLLGLMRNHSLIPHESDIDFFVLEEHTPAFVKALDNCINQFHDAFVRDFSSRGIVQVTTDPKSRHGRRPRKVDAGHVLMDAYVLKRDGDLITDVWNKLNFQKQQIFAVQSLPLYLRETNETIMVTAPNQATVILEALYGKNWSTPSDDNHGKQRTSPYCGAIGNRLGQEWATCF